MHSRTSYSRVSVSAPARRETPYPLREIILIEIEDYAHLPKRLSAGTGRKLSLWTTVACSCETDHDISQPTGLRRAKASILAHDARITTGTESCCWTHS